MEVDGAGLGAVKEADQGFDGVAVELGVVGVDKGALEFGAVNAAVVVAVDLGEDLVESLLGGLGGHGAHGRDPVHVHVDAHVVVEMRIYYVWVWEGLCVKKPC